MSQLKFEEIMAGGKQDMTFFRRILPFAITAIVSALVTGFITLGADRRRLDDVEHGLDAHVKVADAKIEELNVLKTNQAVMAAKLESIDRTVKEINDEIKRQYHR